MLSLNESKLKSILNKKQRTLSQACNDCGISRQSLYAMLKGASVFNTPFTKLITHLNIDPAEITQTTSQGENVLGSAPLKIQKIVLRLKDFCEKYSASLILFGSQAAGTSRASSDWDFGIYFNKKDVTSQLRRLKSQLQEDSFPYRLDVVVLNQAPSWFWASIQDESLLLFGTDIQKMKEAS